MLSSMTAKLRAQNRVKAHRIELNLREVGQLFNTMDPSPFHEKDLDDDAEEFLVGWMQEFPQRDPVELVVHVNHLPVAHGGSTNWVQTAVHNYFAYRAKINHLEFRRLLNGESEGLRRCQPVMIIDRRVALSTEHSHRRCLEASQVF